MRKDYLKVEGLRNEFNEDEIDPDLAKETTIELEEYDHQSDEQSPEQPNHKLNRESSQASLLSARPITPLPKKQVRSSIRRD